MRDLLKRMLEENPSSRIKINEALLHPFFSEENIDDSIEEISPGD